MIRGHQPLLLRRAVRRDENHLLGDQGAAWRGLRAAEVLPLGRDHVRMKVTSYEEKGRAIETLRVATLAGCRGPVRDRIQLVCDECDERALPRAARRERTGLYDGRTLKELAISSGFAPIQVQYGCSGRYFGVSVRELGRLAGTHQAPEYLPKAKSAVREIVETSRSAPARPGVDAALGVQLGLQRRGSLLDGGDAIFDMELLSKGTIGARSLHVFAVRASKSGTRTRRSDGAHAPDRRLRGLAEHVHLCDRSDPSLVAGAMGVMLLSQRGHTDVPAEHSSP